MPLFLEFLQLQQLNVHRYLFQSTRNTSTSPTRLHCIACISCTVFNFRKNLHFNRAVSKEPFNSGALLISNNCDAIRTFANFNRILKFTTIFYIDVCKNENWCSLLETNDIYGFYANFSEPTLFAHGKSIVALPFG